MNEQRMKPRAEVDIQPGNYYWAQHDENDEAPEIVWVYLLSLDNKTLVVGKTCDDEMWDVTDYEFWSDPIPRMEPYKPPSNPPVMGTSASNDVRSCGA